ncbi:MAG: LacI family DNA-binding transcriptional regulator [Brevefilum sp.]|nr:LacI family DNA-binding transcriptional regulator [Brevefilum sp.]
MEKSGNSPTIYDVARAASVSIATVSRVINSPELVNEKTRNTVLQVIDQLGFIPNYLARGLARKEIGHIGVITPFFTIPSITQRLSGISNTLMDTPYNLTIFPVDSTKRLENYYAELPYSRFIAGLIIITLPINDLSLQRFKKNDIPILTVESSVPGYPSIEYDNRYGGRLAAEHLIRKNHLRCAFIGNSRIPEYTISQEEDRFEGYRQTLLSHHIDLPDEYVKLPDLISHDQDRQIHDLLDVNPPPTAVFTSTDELALRVLDVAKNRGVRVPEDLAVIGFDDIAIAAYLKLTTISQSLFESGKLAAERIIAHIKNPTRPEENSFIKLKLVERGST